MAGWEKRRLGVCEASQEAKDLRNEKAKKYATGYMFEKAKKLNIGLTTRIFSADRVEEVSKEMSVTTRVDSGDLTRPI